MTLVLKLRGTEKAEAARITAEVNADSIASGFSGSFIPALIVCSRGHRNPTAIPEDYPDSCWGCHHCDEQGQLGL